MTGLIDLDALKAFVGSDVEMLAELASVYAQVTPQGIEELQKACESGDSEQAAKVAGQLKSRFGAFSAVSLADLASELEYLAEDNRLKEGDELVDSVCQGALDLISELSELTASDSDSDSDGDATL